MLTGTIDDASLLVRARGVTKRFGGLLAVNNVDFDIPRRSIVSLIGPNGAGKTTFFNMITGAYVPTEPATSPSTGSDRLHERHQDQVAKPHEVTALGIGRTFQNIRLFGTMSALDNVRVGHPRPPPKPLVGLGPAHAERCSARSRPRSTRRWAC